LSKRAIEQGAFVTAQYRSSSLSLLPLSEKYGNTRLHLAQADLTSEPTVIQLFESSPSAIEVIVVNHAIAHGTAMVKDMTLERWRNTFDNNLTSSFLVIREYLRQLEKGIAGKTASDRFGERAAIVQVGSTAGKFGEAFNADYAATKSGESQVHLRWELEISLTLASHDVRVDFVAEERNRENCTSRSR